MTVNMHAHESIAFAAELIGGSTAGAAQRRRARRYENGNDAAHATATATADADAPRLQQELLLLLSSSCGAVQAPEQPECTQKLPEKPELSADTSDTLGCAQNRSNSLRSSEKSAERGKGATVSRKKGG